MAATTPTSEIVYGAEGCEKHSLDLLEELGFPKGILPLEDMVECGRVRATGFVWMKQKSASKHYFEKAKTLVSYSEEVTAYVEMKRMRRMTGVKSKQGLFWVAVTEMRIDDPDGRKISYRTPIGVGRSFPITAFMTDEEEARFLGLEKHGADDDQESGSSTTDRAA